MALRQSPAARLGTSIDTDPAPPVPPLDGRAQVALLQPREEVAGMNNCRSTALAQLVLGI